MKEILPGVYLINRYSLKSFGNSGYFVKHDGGNLLVDAPELGQADEDFIRGNGGISDLFITHIRAFGDACAIKSRFNARLIIHEEDAKLVKGCAPDLKFNAEYALRDDITLIPTPGYSPGSSCLLLKRGKGILFCGDMFWWGNRDRFSSELMSWPTQNDRNTWYLADQLVLNVNLLDSDIGKMKESASLLMKYEFDSILMSHPNYPPRGRGAVLSGAKEMLTQTLSTEKFSQFTDWKREELKKTS
jgi:glyoxylase-like metal-dependent hydrolase (beta-lactamase superfamily II)